MANLKMVSEDTFEQDVLRAQSPVLVDFWAEWCAPCRMMTPTLEALAQQTGDQLEVVKLDVQENPDMAVRYGVMNIPTLILFVDGEPAERLIGYMPLESMMEDLAPHLERSP
ncbi:MAG: thioredoxin [Chloroflexota bacterium]|nr:thioredoxin [Chloroflexota bacterium]